MHALSIYFLPPEMITIFFAWVFFFFKQKTAYEILRSDWSSDVCSSDLWHGVSRGFFTRYCHYHPWRKSFTTLGPSSLTRHGWIRLAPIVQDSPLLPPVGVWAVSQSQCC